MDMTADERSKIQGGTKAPQGEPAGAEKLGLEEIVRMTNRIGLEYADAKRHLDRLELMKATVRARISIRLDDGDLSETRLRRVTEVDPEYVAYIEQLIEARHQCDKLRVRYDSYKNLFDARRSLLSYQKAELKLL